MGSKQIKEMDLVRAGDRVRGRPEDFTILGVDIDRAKLLALYAGKATEIAVIKGISQDRRSKALAPPSFVESCEGGVNEPIQFVRLKPDANGKSWLVVDKGNNRCQALRIVNAKRALHGHPPFMLPAIQTERAGSGEAAGDFAEEQHALSNVRAAMLPSHKAEIAAKRKARGLAPHSIIRYLDGVTCEAEVLELLALAECSEATQDACDAGRIPVKVAPRLAKMSEAKQAAWLTAKLAPREPRKANGHARPLPPRKVEALHRELSTLPHLASLVGLLRGTVRPEDITDPDLRAACLRAEIGSAS